MFVKYVVTSTCRRDKEDIQLHVIGARIVFDMSLEDLRFERDDAEGRVVKE